MKALLAVKLLFTLCQIFEINTKFTMNLETAWINASPDGVARQVLGVNNLFPGPTIRVPRGEHVHITLKNQIKDEMTDIHWHGLFQKKTLLADGVGGVTQCDPNFGETYNYSFETKDQSGTYWYHSHAGTQLIDGTKGIFIIDDPKDPFLFPKNTCISEKYRKTEKNYIPKVENSLFYVDHSEIDDDGQPDSVINLTDWHHTLATELLKVYLSPASQGAEPTPDSALINGKGNYSCKVPHCESQYDTKIVSGKAKRFRIINTSAMGVFNFAIDGHTMFVIETDGITLDGKTEIQYLRINAGQRYSVIVKANQKPKNYWIRAQLIKENYPEPPSPQWNPDVFGILHYTDSKGKVFDSQKPTALSFTNMDSLFIKSSTEFMTYTDINVPLVPLRNLNGVPPKKATKTFTINITPLIGADGVKFLGFNNILYSGSMETTLLGHVLNNDIITNTVTENGLQHGYNPYVYKYGDVVDIIINNFDDMQHPIHGHGHAFYVMFNGPSGLNNFILDNVNPYEYKKDASLRDTASINGLSTMIFRFRALNPGIWAFHCHIAWHLDAGLMLTLIEDKNRIKMLYTKYRKLVTKCVMNMKHNEINHITPKPAAPSNHLRQIEKIPNGLMMVR